MALKRLVLHIGAAKCGSSAIQDYLAVNHDTLARAGILVPGQELDINGKVMGQQIWFMEHIAQREDRQEVLRNRLAALSAHMDQLGQSTLIVSAENIANHPSLASSMAAASVGFDVRIVYYVRRQDSYFLSAWQQWHQKRHPSLMQYLADHGGTEANWDQLIQPWEDVFGHDRIKLRLFRRDKLHNGDVVDDFFHMLQLPQDGCIPLVGHSNRSFDDHIGEMAHRIRDVFSGPHDNEFYAVIARLLGAHAFKSGSSSHLLTLDQRREFLKRYEESNESLKKRFFPELGSEPLFEQPNEADVRILSDTEKLEAENAILMRAVFALAKKLEEQSGG